MLFFRVSREFLEDDEQWDLRNTLLGALVAISAVALATEDAQAFWGSRGSWGSYGGSWGSSGELRELAAARRQLGFERRQLRQLRLARRTVLPSLGRDGSWGSNGSYGSNGSWGSSGSQRFRRRPCQLWLWRWLLRRHAESASAHVVTTAAPAKTIVDGPRSGRCQDHLGRRPDQADRRGP